jgi:acetyl-CoA carboxylase biotin carboxyl carrier protein
MDIRKIKKLIELVEESGVSEIEIKEGEETVRISRKIEAPMMPQQYYLPPQPYPSAPHASSAHPTQTAEAPAENKIPEGHIVTSPMVGTFYKAPSPEAAPFVTIGSSVEVGTVLCIIEAMKTLNQIESDKAGVIASILVENGQPIEFGQPLFVIK